MPKIFMLTVYAINKLIQEENYQKLSRIFTVEMRNDIKELEMENAEIDNSKVSPTECYINKFGNLPTIFLQPFNEIIPEYRKYVLYGNSDFLNNVLRKYHIFAEKKYFPIIKELLNNILIKSENPFEIELFNIIQYFSKKNIIVSVYAFNILAIIDFKSKEKLRNLMKIIENKISDFFTETGNNSCSLNNIHSETNFNCLVEKQNIKNKYFSSLVSCFYFYKAIIEIYFEDFLEAGKSIENVKSKRILKKIKEEIAIINILKNNVSKKDKINIIMNSGFINLLEPEIQNFSSNCLFRIVELYFPLICFRNLIKRIPANDSAKIDLSNLDSILGISMEEIQCYAMNCIDKGLIRGYLNLNKNMIIVSKTNPFNELI